MANKVGKLALIVALLLMASTITPHVAEPAAAGPVVATAVERPSLPGRFVIEFADGEHSHQITPSTDDQRSTEPGRAGSTTSVESATETEAEVAEAEEQVASIAAAIEAGRRSAVGNANDLSNQTSSDGSLTLDAAAAAVGGGLSVTYNPAFPAPSQARAAIVAGINVWSDRLSTNGAPVVVEVSWVSFGNPGVLGFAGPADFYSDGGLPPGYFYPAALTNVIENADANGAAEPEIIVVLNADLHASGSWHYGSGNPPFPKVDLRSVVTHEVGHGVGFVSSASNETGSIRLESPPFIYDSLATHQGTPVVSLGNVGPALTSGNVQIKIGAVQKGSLYTPSVWNQGSSVSHFSSTGAQAGTLMNPSLASGSTSRTIDAFALGVLHQMGWPTPDAGVRPAIASGQASGTTVWMTWNHQNRLPGLPADIYRLEAHAGGTVHASVQVPATVTAAGLSDLQPNTNYEIRIIPIADGRPGSPAIYATRTGAATPLTPPAAPPPFVRNLALDGQIFRVYQAHLLRVPDQKGFNFWFNQRARRRPLSEIIADFQAGPEFTKRYGALTDWQFVNLIYRNVLGREPDSAGLNHWSNALAAGASRAEVMAGFVDGTEYINRTNTVGPHSSVEGSIRRLYQAFFLREPSAQNLAYWISVAQAGSSLEAIADQFVGSPEFRNRYGALNNDAFVRLVYQNVLNRPADPGGYSNWMAQLSAGMSRGTMMVGFSESVEFIKRTGTIP